MSARIFVHPRCLSGSPSNTFTAILQERGYDINKLSVGPASKKGHHELVRILGTELCGMMHLERMDGVKFDYTPLQPFGGDAA